MTTISCPICKQNVTIDISKAIDEEGEVFECPHCNSDFRYAPNG